ncbi:hypothetical protein FRC17_003646 [Serendipita sp. 399]|nr:hypothetical protein FRC17_003646 [Serendipita sp. 399]
MGRKSVGGLSSRSSNVYPPPSASISTSSSYREDMLSEDEPFVGTGGFGGGITPRYAGHGAMSFGREEERGNREQRGRSRGVRRGFTMDPSAHHDEDAWLMVDDDAAAADERLRRGRNEAVKILSAYRLKPPPPPSKLLGPPTPSISILSSSSL